MKGAEGMMEHTESFVSQATLNQLQRQKGELRAVSDIARAVNRSLDLQSTLEVGIRETLRIVGGEAGCILLLESKPPRWVIATCQGVDQELSRRLEEAVRGDGSWPAAEGPWSDMLALQSLSDGVKKAMREAGFHSLYVLPLQSRGGVLGMVALANREERLSGLQSIGALMTIAEQLGTAIENARLYQEAQRELAERKRTEEALRESEERLRGILSSLHETMIVVLDREGNHISVWGTPELDKRYCIRSSEMVGKSLMDIFPPREAKESIVGIQRIFETGESLRAEYLAHLPGGDFWHDASFSPLRGPSGEVWGVVGFVRDITGRKRAEEALRESEEKYRSLVEDSIDGIAIVQGLETRFANRALLKIFGCQSEDEMVGHTFTDFVSPEYRNLMVERGRAREKGEYAPSRYEFKALRKNGTEFEAELSVSRVAYEGGVARQGIVRDITERKCAEEALKESLAQIELAKREWEFTADSLPQFVCLLDHRGCIIRTNRTVEKWNLGRIKEVKGLGVHELFHPGCTDPACYLEAFWLRAREELARGQPAECEAEDKILDRHLHIQVRPILAQTNGEVDEGASFAVISVHDITERKQAEEELEGYRHHLEELVEERTAELRAEITERKRAEEALREGEERYRSLFERVPVGLYRTTSEGQILDVNPVLLEILGFPDWETALAANAADGYANPEDRGRWQILIERDGVVRDFEVQWRRHDGTMIWVKESARVVRDTEGRVIYYEGSVEDITERKRAQEHLMHTERLAAMGRLAATLAHEINNPLQAISNSLELTLDFPLEEEERQEYLQAARREIERLMVLTDRVLNFARPPQFERQATSVADVVRHALALASKELHNSDIRVSLDLPDVVPPVLTLSSHLSQVFLNLMINVIEAMPDGGELSISAQLAGDQVEVTFTDSGPGIPPDAMARLFEPFYTTKEDGTGLGLATSYSIIQQHGGTMTAGNAPGDGAVFTVAVPVAPSDEPYVAERS